MLVACLLCCLCHIVSNTHCGQDLQDFGGAGAATSSGVGVENREMVIDGELVFPEVGLARLRQEGQDWQIRA